MKNIKTLKKTNKKERKSGSIMQTETHRERMLDRKKIIEGRKLKERTKADSIHR